MFFCYKESSLITAKDSSFAAAELSHKRRPQQRGKQSALNLLDAAAQLFVEKGFDETTIDDIVARARIAKGTFYYHYESKNALLIALRYRVLERYQEHIDVALAECSEHNMINKLDIWVSATCDAYIKIGALQEIIFSNVPRWTAGKEKYIKDFIDILKKGHNEGIWIAENTEFVATFIFKGILGIIDDLIITEKSLNEVISTATTLVHRTISLK